MALEMEKKVIITEPKMADKAQRSTHAAVTLNKGQIIKKSDLIYKRPGYGLNHTYQIK